MIASMELMDFDTSESYKNIHKRYNVKLVKSKTT